MEGGSVVRYHTRPGIRPDTDAHHSHGVAMLCSLIMPPQEDGRTSASTNLLMAALTHDLAEQFASDVSSPAKRALDLGDRLWRVEQEVLDRYNLSYERHLSHDEKIVLRLADGLDMLMYCCRELALGNRNALLIWRRACSYIETFQPPEVHDQAIALRAIEIYNDIKSIYHEVTSAGGPDFDIFACE